MQCVNVKCLHKNSEDTTVCQACGSPLIIDGRLRATKLLSNPNLFAHPEVKTFEAIALETSEKVILKVVQSENTLLINALQESALALRQVHLLKPHPGIMQLVEQAGYFTWRVVQVGPESHFIAVKRVEGHSLETLIEQDKDVSERTAIQWLRQLVESVEALHKEGFVHQDIKPSNIICRSADNHLVLVDLGAIRFMDATQSLDAEIRQGLKTYPVIGTPGYQAREQDEGRPNQTSDYYSIGRTLIHLLTGVYPGDLPHGSNEQPLWRARAQVSEAFADLIDRMAQPNQLFRPATAAAIYEYLDALEVEPDMPLVLPQKNGQQNRLGGWRTVLVVALALGLSLLGVGGALSALLSRADANRLFSRANQLIYAGDPGRAVSELERAVELNPNSVELRATLAFARYLSGNPNAAIEDYRRALALSPDDAFIHYNLANVYEQVDAQQAIVHYQLAAQEDSPIQADAINNLVRVYLLEGDLDNAEEALQLSSDDVLTQAALLKNRGWLLFEQGKRAQALRSLTDAIDRDPTRPDAYCLRALIQQQQGDDNFDDRVTCLSLPMPDDRPEVQGWKAQLIKN